MVSDQCLASGWFFFSIQTQYVSLCIPCEWRVGFGACAKVLCLKVYTEMWYWTVSYLCTLGVEFLGEYKNFLQ